MSPPRQHLYLLLDQLNPAMLEPAEQCWYTDSTQHVTWPDPTC